MGEIDQEVASEVSDLQANISAVLGGLEGLSEDHPQYEALFARLVSASSSLLEYEARIPEKLEEPQRHASKAVLTWSAGVHLAEAVVIGLAPFFTGITWWWLLAVAAQAIVSFAVLPDVSVVHHRQQRAAGITLTVVTIVLPLIVFSVLSAWFLVLVILGWVVAFVLAVDADTNTGKKEAA